MLRIYDFEGFPNPARVRIAIAEKHATDKVEFVSVDVPSGAHQKADFLARNPGGAVPVLELEDETCISECTAITEFLDHTFDGISLTGQGARQRAKVHMMQRRAEQSVLDAVAGYFHHATPGLGPDIEKYQNAEWGENQKIRSMAGMRYFDGVLGQSPWVAGEEFSMADITLFAGLAFADFAAIEVPDSCVNLIAWRKRMSQRPSIAN